MKQAWGGPRIEGGVCLLSQGERLGLPGPFLHKNIPHYIYDWSSTNITQARYHIGPKMTRVLYNKISQTCILCTYHANIPYSLYMFNILKNF